MIKGFIYIYKTITVEIKKRPNIEIKIYKIWRAFLGGIKEMIIMEKSMNQTWGKKENSVYYNG